LKNIKPSLFRGCKSSVSWVFKQLFEINVANNFNTMAFSKAFCRNFPLKAKYEGVIWDCLIMLNYYRNYTESLTELPREERLINIHNFYIVKTTTLILFYNLLRPIEVFRIKARDGWMVKELDGVCFKIKTRSSCNRDTFIFIPEMEDKRICPWQTICK
jgi:hypothetical protein